MKPRVVALGMLKNEADIIEGFVRHTLHFVDAMVLIENGSVDGTRQILDALVQEGLPLILFDDPIFDYFQSEKMTHLHQRVQAEMAPDFVLLLDADEFIACASRVALEQALAQIPTDGYGLVRWMNYVAPPGYEGGAGVDPVRAITRRVTPREDRGRDKAIIRSDTLVGARLIIDQGNHRVLRRPQPLGSVRLQGLALAHFPVRGANHLVIKTVQGWLSYIARSRSRESGTQASNWREAYEMVARGEAFDALRVVNANLFYSRATITDLADLDALLVEAPLPVHAERRYSPAQAVTPLGLVTQIAASLLRSDQALGFTLPLQAPAMAGAQDDTLAGPRLPAAPLYLDLPPLRQVLRRFRPLSLLELGCGTGGHLHFARGEGVADLLGIDGLMPSGGHLAPEFFRQGEIGAPLDLGRRFDAVVCLERASQLAPEAGGRLLDTLCGHAGEVILFSAAAPGQPGTGHRNLQPVAYWLAEFAARGWGADLFQTLAVRTVATFPWFRQNLLVLRRGLQGDAEVAALLAERGRRAVLWKQEAAVVAHPFRLAALPGR